MTTINRYEITQKIADGGMAEVYQAVDSQIGREVALKLLPPGKDDVAEYLARFKREARLIALLAHPHIVRLYDYGVDPTSSRPFLVMEYMAGQTLKERLNQLKPEDVWQIIDDIGGAISAAHREKVVHRDLKPSNILFDRGGNAYLSDFGIALEEDAETQLTGMRVVGTPQFMSPEQCEPEQAITPASDQYSFAVLIYLMFTKAHLFRGNSMQVMYQHLHDAPRLERLIELELPLRVIQALKIALSKRPEARFSSVDAFLAAILYGEFESSTRGIGPLITNERVALGQSNDPQEAQSRWGAGPLGISILAGLATVLLIFSLAGLAVQGGWFNRARLISQEANATVEIGQLLVDQGIQLETIKTYPDPIHAELEVSEEVVILVLDEELPETFVIESENLPVIVINRFGAQAELDAPGVLGVRHSSDRFEAHCLQGACRLIGDVDGEQPLVSGEAGQIGLRGVPGSPTVSQIDQFADLIPSALLAALSPTITPTATNQPLLIVSSATPTATMTPTQTETPSRTQSPTLTATALPTATPSLTPTSTSAPTLAPALVFPTEPPPDPRDLDGDGVLHDPNNGFYDLCQDAVGNPGTCGCPADRIPSACGGGGGGGGSTATPQSLP